MVFNILIGKSGFQSRIVSKVDPVKKDSIEIELLETDSDVPDDCKMTGTVLDGAGKPVLGAVVSITGAMQKGRKWWGQVKHVDHVAITGEDGKFLLTSSEGYEKWQLAIRARQFCGHHTQMLETGKHHTMKMDPGTLVTGRVVENGKPVAGHVIGIYPEQIQDFHGRLFTKSREIATDENGRFEFVATRPNISWNIYSMMENKEGLIETEAFDAGPTGKTKDLGEFELLAANTIRGTIKMVDGAEFPKDLRLFLNRDYAWDHRSLVLKDDGKFEFKVPANELIEISMLADGFRLSKSKNKFQAKSELAFRACMDKDVKEFEVWLEPK